MTYDDMCEWVDAADSVRTALKELMEIEEKSEVPFTEGVDALDDLLLAKMEEMNEAIDAENKRELELLKREYVRGLM